MEVLFGRPIRGRESWALIHEKEEIYRELFAPVFAEVSGFQGLCATHGARPEDRRGHGGRQAQHRVCVHAPGDGPDAARRGGRRRRPAGKPEPAIFLEAARRMGAVAGACIVFEDAPFGIEAARRAGMRAVAVCTSHSADELAGPHVLASVRNYNELISSDFLGNLHAA
jgi:beta-phosphoglucomutase-like phosphatase (HAD superfamily)